MANHVMAVPEPKTELNLELVRHTWRLWWHLCLPAGIVIAAIAVAIVWMSFVPVYEAIAWLRIESTSPFLVFPGDEKAVAVTQGDVFVRTQLELIRSPIVLEPLLQESEIASVPEIRQMENPVRELGRAITVKSENESELYQVVFSASSPRDAANVVNAVVSQYLKFHEVAGQDRNQNIIRLLEGEVAERGEILSGMRSRVRNLTQQLTGEDPRVGIPADATNNTTYSPLQKWMTELGSSEVERAILEATLESLQKSTKQEAFQPPQAMIQRYVDEDSTVLAQKQIVASEQAQLESMLTVMKPGVVSPDLTARRKRVSDAEARLKAIQDESRRRAVGELATRVRFDKDEEQRSSIEETERQINSHKVLERLLTEKIDEFKESQKGAGESAVNLEFARRDLARVEQVYELLLKRINELKTEKRAPSRVDRLQPAGIPSTPVEILPWKKFGIAGVVGLILPFLFAIMFEFRAQRISDPNQLASIGSLALCGEVTSLPGHTRLLTPDADNQLLMHRAAFEDSVHYLCRSILLSAGDELRTIALTSAVSGEGKTSLSAQLAVSLAQCSHEPIILIDADIRAPDLHTVFDLPLSPGLAEVLLGECTLNDVVRPTSVENLHFLPAGNAALHPHGLLQHDQLGMILAELRADYQYIILDTPPALAVGESLSACALADGVLICALRDVSRQQQMQLLQQRLRMTGVRILGAVLSGVSPRHYMSRYGDLNYRQEQS